MSLPSSPMAQHTQGVHISTCLVVGILIYWIYGSWQLRHDAQQQPWTETSAPGNHDDTADARYYDYFATEDELQASLVEEVPPPPAPVRVPIKDDNEVKHV